MEANNPELATFDVTTGMGRFYKEYLQFNDCKSMFTILNKFSRVDALITSGDTYIVVEYKNRNLSIRAYNTCILEKQKYIKLVEASKLFDELL